MPTSYTLLADDVWRCVLPYLTVSAVHRLTHLDTHLHRTLSREPCALLVLADCCQLLPAQLEAALKGGRSAVSVMRRLLSSAAAVEDMLGGGCGLGKLHQAMLLHSLLCGMQYADGAAHSRTASSSVLCSSTSASASSVFPSCQRSLSTSVEADEGSGTCVFAPPPSTSPAAPKAADKPSLIAAPPSTSSAASTSLPTPASSSASSHLSLLYLYDPPAYPLPSPFRILSATSSPAAHFPFPHPYFALWLASRWHDRQWMAEWVGARRREQDVENARRRRRRELMKQYSCDTGVYIRADRAEAKDGSVTADEQQDEGWSLQRHERVAAATIAELSRCVRWLGEFASPTRPHGEVFGYLVAPLIKRQGRTRHATREYEFAYIDEQTQPSEPYQPPGAGGWDRVPVVSWRVVSAPSRMRFGLTVWPCLYTYMKSLCAPGLIDGWAKRIGVERPVLTECSVRGRMFLHMAAMDRWEAIQ